MRSAILGSLLGIAIAAVAFGFPGSRETPRAEGLPSTDVSSAIAPLAASAGDLIAVATPGDEKSSLLTVIDTRREVLSVYGIDRETGKVALLSVRGIHWDMEMTEFNAERPLPGEIRGMLRSE